MKFVGDRHLRKEDPRLLTGRGRYVGDITLPGMLHVVHGYDEIAEGGMLAGEVMDGIEAAVVIEDYPTYPRGPCVLVFQRDGEGRPIHVVWGIPRGQTSPAVLVTAYRPDPARWTDDFLRRRQ